jgi:hypothetical protein
MRRIKLFVACSTLIVASLPLLPGPGALIITEAIAVLEREFLWVRRVMDALQSMAPGYRRTPPPVRDAARLHRHA